MISLDFSLGISLYLVILVGSVLMVCLFSRREKDRDLSLDPKFIWHCLVCAYAYINTKDEAISLCPRCGSYNKKDTEVKESSEKVR